MNSFAIVDRTRDDTAAAVLMLLDDRAEADAIATELKTLGHDVAVAELRGTR